MYEETSPYTPLSRRRSLPCFTARERIIRRAGPGGTPRRPAIVRTARPVRPSGWPRINARTRSVLPGIVTVTSMLQPAGPLRSSSRLLGSTSTLFRHMNFEHPVSDDGHLGLVLEPMRLFRLARAPLTFVPNRRSPSTATKADLRY